eukprot:758028-Prymnesium_polylepis.1
MSVCELPPSESESSLVRLESRYGTCTGVPLARACPDASALITWPSAKSERLIEPASFSPTPAECEARTFSEPARSRSETRP